MPSLGSIQVLCKWVNDVADLELLLARAHAPFSADLIQPSFPSVAFRQAAPLTPFCFPLRKGSKLGKRLGVPGIPVTNTMIIV